MEALTFEVLFHLQEEMGVWRCQIRTIWWMWKNFLAPGVQEIHGCGSTVRSSIVMQKKNLFGQQFWSLVTNSLLESLLSILTSSCIYCWTRRCEINQKNSMNIPENSSCHFLWHPPWCFFSIMRSITVTGDETWIFHYTPENKTESVTWKHSHSQLKKKFKTVQSPGKVITVFWDAHRFIFLWRTWQIDISLW